VLPNGSVTVVSVLPNGSVTVVSVFENGSVTVSPKMLSFLSSLYVSSWTSI
jgi:hypothetical protein